MTPTERERWIAFLDHALELAIQIRVPTERRSFDVKESLIGYLEGGIEVLKLEEELSHD